MPYLITAVIPAHVYDPKRSVHSFHDEQGNPITKITETGPDASSFSVTARSKSIADTMVSVLKSLYDTVTVTEVDNTDSKG